MEKMCECGHVWEEHEALAGGPDLAGDAIVVCMHIERHVDHPDAVRYTVCGCKEWRELQLPSASEPLGAL